MIPKWNLARVLACWGLCCAALDRDLRLLSRQPEDSVLQFGTADGHAGQQGTEDNMSVAIQRERIRFLLQDDVPIKRQEHINVSQVADLGLRGFLMLSNQRREGQSQNSMQLTIAIRSIPWWFWAISSMTGLTVVGCAMCGMWHSRMTGGYLKAQFEVQHSICNVLGCGSGGMAALGVLGFMGAMWVVYVTTAFGRASVGCIIATQAMLVALSSGIWAGMLEALNLVNQPWVSRHLTFFRSNLGLCALLSMLGGLYALIAARRCSVELVFWTATIQGLVHVLVSGLLAVAAITDGKESSQGRLHQPQREGRSWSRSRSSTPVPRERKPGDAGEAIPPDPCGPHYHYGTMRPQHPGSERRLGDPTAPLFVGRPPWPTAERPPLEAVQRSGFIGGLSAPEQPRPPGVPRDAPNDGPPGADSTTQRGPGPPRTNPDLAGATVDYNRSYWDTHDRPVTQLALDSAGDREV
mmetsp:Transcript_22507/g.49244  ORF Transcript_22507/g.49244 Transcript_22507/m.49244 type:complete len:466 (+) Transcript_22507:63-1460(+)